MGATNPDDAKRVSPNSIRAQLGTTTIRNAVHGSHTSNAAARELGFFFDD